MVLSSTTAGYSLSVIFCSPSTSSGVITVFLRSSSSVLTGMPISDELQPCCTFMSSRRGLQPGIDRGSLLLLLLRAAQTDLLRRKPSDVKQALRCYQNNSFSMPPPPLFDPVGNKNHCSAPSPFASLSQVRLIGFQKLFNPNPALNRARCAVLLFSTRTASMNV